MKLGDIVEGLPSASSEYSVTKEGTQWVVTGLGEISEDGTMVEIRTSSIRRVAESLSRFLSKGKELNQNIYSQASMFDNNTYWVYAKHFKVCGHIMSHRLLQGYLSNKDKKNALLTLEGDGVIQ